MDNSKQTFFNLLSRHANKPRCGAYSSICLPTGSSSILRFITFRAGYAVTSPSVAIESTNIITAPDNAFFSNPLFSKLVCLFVLRLYGPVNTWGHVKHGQFYLSTLFTGQA